MLINGTSDKIQFRLGGAVATTQLAFTVDYNTYSSTSVTPVSANGTSNNATAVDLVTSPSAGQQNELRYCSINNTDTASATVQILVFDGTNTRVVFRAVLASGDILQYQLEKGWEVLDTLGNKKNANQQVFEPSLRGTSNYRPGSIAASTGTLTSGTWYMIKAGRAEKAYTSINIAYNVTTLASTITWAEWAVYTGATMSNAFNSLAFRAGSTSVASVVNSTGAKNTTISTSGINVGDTIYLVYAISATTTGALRSYGWTDDSGTTNWGSSAATVNNNRPSLIPSTQLTVGSATQIFVVWQGN